MELKVSVVVTVRNDEVGIAELREALGRQTVKPDEVIVIRAEEFGNCSRGRGRNTGIKMARNEVIAVTDAGCRPRRDWLEKIYKCYKNYKNKIESSNRESPCHTARRHPIFAVANLLAVAGGYRAAARTELERVMAGFLAPVDYFKDSPWHTPRRILPASRSIMFTKAAWQAAGGYPEEAVSGGEDLEFARRLAANPDVKMIYCPEAVVDWQPPKNLGEFFRDIVKHTRGNVEIMYWPHLWRNLTVVLRWGVFWVFPWMIPIYLGIKIIKIITIINGLRSNLAIRQGDTLNLFGRFLFIPVVQAAADAGVMWGLALGMMGRISHMSRMGLMR